MQKLICFFILCFITTKSFSQQNIILIIADDTGTDYYGFSEDAKDTANVPVIRSLLPNGIRFKNAWANPVCSPTRAAMISGRYAFRNGVGYVITNNASPQLDTAEMALPKLLKYYAPVPYQTGCAGKWHLHNFASPKYNYPAVMGFDFYSGNFNGALTDYYNYVRVTNGVVDSVMNTYATTQTVNDAISWLDTINQAQPFFLWLAFNAPHTPYHKPPDSLHTATGLTGTPQHINQFPELYFKAALEALDTETGRLLQWLTAHNMMDSTNVIFIGDNGNEQAMSQISNPLHSKGTVYEQGVHVPYIISGPAVVNQGTTSEALVSTTDLFATILDMCGFTNWHSFIPPNKLPTDAVSLFPILSNQSVTVRDWIFAEVFQTPTNANDGKAIRNNDYKLIRFDTGSQKFYNIATDSLEQYNLLTGTLNTTESTNYSYLCSVMDSLLSTNNCIVSVKEHANNDQEIKVLTSPTGNTISICASGIFEFKLVDEMGRLVKNGKAFDNATIKTSGFSNGMYVLLVTDNTDTRFFKVVK